jgi:hypothetical protein
VLEDMPNALYCGDNLASVRESITSESVVASIRRHRLTVGREREQATPVVCCLPNGSRSVCRPRGPARFRISST